MQLSRANSEINLYSPFLLKFEGRMTQISKKGTLTVPPPAFTSSFQREAKKLTSNVLNAKRADNILLDLNEVRDRNAKALLHMTNRHEEANYHEENPIRRQDCFATVLEHQPPKMTPSVIAEGAFSEDFRRMLRQLDNLSPAKKNK